MPKIGDVKTQNRFFGAGNLRPATGQESNLDSGKNLIQLKFGFRTGSRIVP